MRAYLIGDWFSFLIDEEDVAERIGLNERYEEYAVDDTENFPIEIGEYISIQELNEMYEMICEIPDFITDSLDEFVSNYGNLEELYNHKDDMILYAGCEDMTDVAYYLLYGMITIPIIHFLVYAVWILKSLMMNLQKH
ncbi:antirestriction protein ArdA [Longibaculum muris]